MLKRSSLFSPLCFGRPRLILMVLALFAGFLAMAAGPAARGQSTPTTATMPNPTAGSMPTVEHVGGEANLHLPDLNTAKFFHDSIGGRTLLTYGLIFCVAGVAFGLIVYVRLKNMAVHPSMLEVS
ncbi:MAG TPA: hypothetical protein VHM90_00870, partial [Phycisphaerae bacterium]|nr:hypothetical protein [Phycisphaerae bacterium]